MMVTDTEIYSWFKELGMKLEKVTSGGIYFHFTVSPPTGGLPVSIIRTSPDTTYYIVAVILDLDQEKLKSNPTVISAIKKELLKLNVEFFFSPDEKSPRSIQIARILFSEV